MTVADLIFSPDLSRSQPYYHVLYQRLMDVMASAPWTRFTMKVKPDLSCSHSIRLTMTPHSDLAREALQLWRKAIYERTADITVPEEDYHFHVTLAYVMYPFFHDERGRHELAPFQRKQNERLQQIQNEAFVFPG